MLAPLVDDSVRMVALILGEALALVVVALAHSFSHWAINRLNKAREVPKELAAAERALLVVTLCLVVILALHRYWKFLLDQM